MLVIGLDNLIVLISHPEIQNTKKKTNVSIQMLIFKLLELILIQVSMFSLIFNTFYKFF